MLTLILGGARSGKSDLAVRMAAASGRGVLFIATMEPADDEMRHRLAAHRAARPRAWRTVEEPRGVAAAIDAHARAGDTVVVDCVTLWVSNLLAAEAGDPDRLGPAAAAAATEAVVRRAAALAERAARFDGDVLIVSNEVGLGLVPPYPLGRLFRDALGGANRAIAARAGRVYYLVAGLALDLTSLGALPLDAFGEAPGP